MLVPSKIDPNYKAEMERRKRDPMSFGMAAPAVEPERNLTGSGLSADRDRARAEEEAAAKTAEVVVATPEEIAATWRAFLDRPVPDIAAQLPELDEEQLVGALEAEQTGANRKTLISAIEEEFNNRKGA